MLGDALEHHAQEGVGIEVVEPRAADEAAEESGALAAAVGVGEEVVLAPERDVAQGALGGVVVDLQVPALAVAR